MSIILVMFHSDDFRLSEPPQLLAEWDILVAAFEAARYKVSDCTKEPFVGIVPWYSLRSYLTHWMDPPSPTQTTPRMQQRPQNVPHEYSTDS